MTLYICIYIYTYIIYNIYIYIYIYIYIIQTYTNIYIYSAIYTVYIYPDIFSWPWLSLLCGWDSLNMTFTSKFVYMAHHFILLRLNPFDLRVDKEGWWFEHSVS